MSRVIGSVLFATSLSARDAGWSTVTGRPAARDREADRALAGDDDRIAVRMDERASVALLELVREGERVVVDVADEPHVRAVRAAALDDAAIDAARHDDRRRRTETPGRPRDGLPVIAGRRGDDAAREAVAIERRELRERAAHLVRPRRLNGLELQPHLGAEFLRQLWRRLERRRDAQVSPHDGARAVDIGEPNPRFSGYA